MAEEFKLSEIKPYFERVLEYMKSKGFDFSTIRDSNLAYKKPHTFRQMLEAFRLRNITTFGSEIPDKIRLKMYAELMDWCHKKRIKLDEIIMGVRAKFLFIAVNLIKKIIRTDLEKRRNLIFSR